MAKIQKVVEFAKTFATHSLWVLITEIYRVEDDGDLRYLMHHAYRV